jgi:preprotein translocase subunit SecF
MNAVAVAAFGKVLGHSLNGKFVVSTRLRRSYRRLTTWKSRSPARAS